MQKLCKIPGFSLIKSNQPEDLDQEPLENIVFQANDIAPIITSLVFGVGPILRSLLISHLASIKLLAILVIICKSAHQNNSNYIFLFVAMYMYSAGTKVDAITLFNQLDLSVLYNVLLRKLRSITISNAAFIQE